MIISISGTNIENVDLLLFYFIFADFGYMQSVYDTVDLPLVEEYDSIVIGGVISA